MKKPFLAVCIILSPAVVSAAGFNLNVEGNTIFRFEQRSVPGLAKQNLAPATQFLRADLDNIGDGNLSLHLYGWGRLDLADKSTSEGSTDGDLSYAYLSYRLPRANAEIRAGRFFIYEGVANEQIDGISARADLQKGMTLSLFGGAPVRLDWSKNKGDYIVGGRGSWRLPGILELGVSGLREGGVVIDPASGATDDRKMVGGDIWLAPFRATELSGHTFYNASTGGIAEQSYFLTVKPLKVVTVSAVYNEQHFNDYFFYSNLRSLFNPVNGGDLKSYGGGVTVIVAPPVEITADYRRYNRTSDVSTDNNGNSDRYGAEARVTLFDRKVRSGFSYHRSDGASGFNSYAEVRGYCLYDANRYVVSLDAIDQYYRNSVSGKKNAFEVIASTGIRIMPELALSGDLSYGQNPRLNDELRGALRLTYNYETASKGAAK
jgi:hypothetical protein